MKYFKLIWKKIFILLQHNIPKYHGFLILEKLNKISIIFNEFYENKNYDINTNGEEFILKKLNRSNNLKCIFDIGANKGIYSILSRKISSSAEIFAFEPVYTTFQSLKSNVKNMGINSYNFAFGKKNEISLINIYEQDTLASMLSFQNEFLDKEFQKVEIELKTGNYFLSENPEIKEISLLKIDTEGFENFVLEGFNDYLEIVNVIQFEYGLANLSSRYFLFDYFRDFSHIFKIGKLYPKGVIFYDKYNLELENFIGPNFLMVRKDRKDLIDLLTLR